MHAVCRCVGTGLRALTPGEGRSIIHVTIADIRGNGPNPNFRGSSGAIWVR